MLQLLREVEQISGCRDRDILAASVVATLREVFSARAVRLLRLLHPGSNDDCEIVAQADADGVKIVTDPADDCPRPATTKAPFGLTATAPAPCWTEESEGLYSVTFPVPDAGASTPLHLEIMAIAAPDAESREALERFVRIYTNYIGLLDYSERDTLTGLLNRKTFDESFDRLLQQTPAAAAEPRQERRLIAESASRRWIGVVDIDHFKRVNDGFGHLFGDEVLLRVANLMKHTFRRTDRLFRFGGEEFVVMLQPTSDVDAQMVFDRFRVAVETHEFPQIGQVTCSIGFTAVDATLAPTDILGRADQALYYSKENGRNQTHNYRRLVDRGVIPASAGARNQPAFDIDALFA